MESAPEILSVLLDHFRDPTPPPHPQTLSCCCLHICVLLAGQ